MGEQKVTAIKSGDSMHKFVNRLIKDVHALEYMLEHDWFETDTIRIGAEQEMTLVNNQTFKPCTLAMEAIDLLKAPSWLDTELAKFNLEINLEPLVFKDDCLSAMEASLNQKMDIIRQGILPLKAKPILTGILPTLRKYDLELHNLTPRERYKILMDAINEELIGNSFELRLRGIDEILVKHDSPLLEACNTSFQVHLQVKPNDFVHLYNIAQTLTAPVMAISANSPIVFGRRLWHESRIALFQQALDIRTTQEHMRERSPRVSFGDNWLDNSILEIYKEDIARFRVLLSTEVEEDALELIHNKKVPKLKALQVHNSTVYRWNRPCYGISENGMPHLRIENRVLPAGPTTRDEMANAALWLGAMVGYAKYCKDIRTEINWEDVRDNFGKAAQFGIDSKFTWFNDRKISASDLVSEEILPIAREGLELQNVNSADIDLYMGIIQDRAKQHKNGATWQIKAYTKLKNQTSEDEALSVLTNSIIMNQEQNIPIHEWKVPELSDLKEYTPSQLKVEEFMQTDLFTAQKDDSLELVTHLMDWRSIRFLPIEDKKGKLGGLITARLLLRHFSKPTVSTASPKSVLVKDIMIKDPLTINPKTSIIEAMRLMRKNKIGCLPVTQNDELIGVITENDFLRISARLIERLEREED
ncbi:MAG: glutamate-cysteine ligase family protein [Saprospiraceae bacterium]